MIKKIRNKITEKEAMLFEVKEKLEHYSIGDYASAKSIEEWSCGKAITAHYNPREGTCAEMTIYTLEGSHKASPGDWIIKGLKGEFYPCKPDIFEKSYEIIS